MKSPPKLMHLLVERQKKIMQNVSNIVKLDKKLGTCDLFKEFNFGKNFLDQRV